MLHVALSYILNYSSMNLKCEQGHSKSLVLGNTLETERTLILLHPPNNLL